MPTETAAGGAALIKLITAPAVASAVAITVGFLLMWPKTQQEAFARFTVTLLSSFFLGPLLVIAARSYFPNMFDAAKLAAADFGYEPTFGLIALSAPLLVMAGLPSWWILGGIVRWLEKRNGKDIAEIAQDAADAVRQIRSGK